MHRRLSAPTMGSDEDTGTDWNGDDVDDEGESQPDGPAGNPPAARQRFVIPIAAVVLLGAGWAVSRRRRR